MNAISSVKLITIDRRERDIYSASFWVPSSSRPGLKHHVVLWFRVYRYEDGLGERQFTEIELTKYSCSCEDFTFRARQCKHILLAKEEARKLIERGVEIE